MGRIVIQRLTEDKLCQYPQKKNAKNMLRARYERNLPKGDGSLSTLAVWSISSLNQFQKSSLNQLQISSKGLLLMDGVGREDEACGRSAGRVGSRGSPRVIALDEPSQLVGLLS